MPTLYGSAAYGGDGNWDDLFGQWWTDTFGGTAASATPAPGDTVYTDGTFTTGPAAPVTLASYDSSANAALDSMDYSNVFVSVSLNLWGGTWINDLPASISAAFTNNANNSGLISGGSITFVASYNLSSIDAGSVDFTFSSQNESSIEGGTVTFDSSLNLGTINGGSIYFTDYAINAGAISGGAVAFDPESSSNTISNGGGVIDFCIGTNCTLSYDGGTTWFVAKSLVKPGGNRGIHQWMPC